MPTCSPVHCSAPRRRKTPRQRRAGARRARTSFASGHASLRHDLNATRKALYRRAAARHRLEAKKARTDMREWVVKRRARTKQLIELGGLVVKAGLVDLTDYDRSEEHTSEIKSLMRISYAVFCLK